MNSAYVSITKQLQTRVCQMWSEPKVEKETTTFISDTYTLPDQKGHFLALTFPTSNAHFNERPDIDITCKRFSPVEKPTDVLK